MAAQLFTSVQLRWRDGDANGHVNNAVFLTYLEAGRDALFEHIGISRTRTVLVRCAIDFVAPIPLDLDAVTCHAEVVRIGTTSVATAERLLGGDTLVGRASSVSVYTDAAGGAVPVPEGVVMASGLPVR